MDDGKQGLPCHINFWDAQLIVIKIQSGFSAHSIRGDGGLICSCGLRGMVTISALILPFLNDIGIFANQRNFSYSKKNGFPYLHILIFSL